MCHNEKKVKKLLTLQNFVLLLYIPKKEIIMNKQKGFTLIELLVVMAIISILATIGLTMYSKYSDRAKSMADFNSLNNAKLLVVEYHAIQGTFLGFNYNDNNLETVNTTNKKVTLSSKNRNLKFVLKVKDGVLATKCFGDSNYTKHCA